MTIILKTYPNCSFWSETVSEKIVYGSARNDGQSTGDAIVRKGPGPEVRVVPTQAGHRRVADRDQGEVALRFFNVDRRLHHDLRGGVARSDVRRESQRQRRAEPLKYGKRSLETPRGRRWRSTTRRRRPRGLQRFAPHRSGAVACCSHDTCLHSRLPSAWERRHGNDRPRTTENQAVTPIRQAHARLITR